MVASISYAVSVFVFLSSSVIIIRWVSDGKKSSIDLPLTVIVPVPIRHGHVLLPFSSASCMCNMDSHNFLKILLI